MNENRIPPWTVSLGCAVSLAVCIWDIAWAVSDEEVFDSRSFLAILLGASTLPLAVLFEEEVAGSVDAETVLYSLAEIIVLVLLFARASNK
jgi:hypothetical protein